MAVKLKPGDVVTVAHGDAHGRPSNLTKGSIKVVFQCHCEGQNYDNKEWFIGIAYDKKFDQETWNFAYDEIINIAKLSKPRRSKGTYIGERVYQP